MTYPPFRFLFNALLIFTLIASNFVNAEPASHSTKERLFKGAYLAHTSAKDKNADFLAPETFGLGLRALTSAEKAYKKNKPIEKIQKALVKAIGYYEAAEVATAKAEDELAGVLKARVIAMGVQAQRYSEKDWAKAEKLLTKAIAKLEADKLRAALRFADKAVAIFKSTELVAIKAESLDETRRLIEKADASRLDKLAPITVRKAKELLATAEVELTENRYDVDLPRSLAQEARYEIKHSFHLAKHIKTIRDQDLTHEQLILESEKPLQQVAAAADINARFDQGLAPVAGQMVDYIDALNRGMQKYKQQLADKDLQIAGLTELINEFAQLYGGVGTSVADMERHLAVQEELLQKVGILDSMFTRDQARIFRDSREIYIRLVGLSFTSGSAHIDADNYSVLDRVIRALELFPNSHVIVEGHTDSFGGDDANLILSKNRAEAVRNFLVNNASVSGTHIEAMGLGETRPFANNDTPQGRSLNRRIDIRILATD